MKHHNFKVVLVLMFCCCYQYMWFPMWIWIHIIIIWAKWKTTTNEMNVWNIWQNIVLYIFLFVTCNVMVLIMHYKLLVIVFVLMWIMNIDNYIQPILFKQNKQHKQTWKRRNSKNKNKTIRKMSVEICFVLLFLFSYLQYNVSSNFHIHFHFLFVMYMQVEIQYEIKFVMNVDVTYEKVNWY
jgi:hypothetical protein